MKLAARITIFVLIATLFLMAAVPALGANGGTVRLTIDNQSAGKAYLKLEGDSMYSFVVLRKTAKEYTPNVGTYKYQLTACGQTTRGKLDLTIYRTLVVPPCGGALKDYSNGHNVDLDDKARPITFTIASVNPKTVYVSLSGAKTYNFKVPGGGTQAFSVANGKYSYVVSVCGTVVKGKVDLTKYQVMNVPVCGAAATGKADDHQVYISLNNLVRVNFTNTTSSDVSVRIEGPKNYSLYVPAGLSKSYTVFRGTYSLLYTACGKAVKGKIEAQNNAVFELACP